MRSAAWDPVLGLVILVVALLHQLTLRELLARAPGSETIRHMFVDVWGWLSFLDRVHAGQVPYVDFWREYPVGAGLIYALLGWNLGPAHHDVVLETHGRVMGGVAAAVAAGVY